MALFRLLGRKINGSVSKDTEASADVFAFPLSPAQEQLWRHNESNPNSPVYNASFRWRFDGALDGYILERTFNEIVRRHEVLRCTFDETDAGPVQLVAPSLALHLVETDLRSLPASARDIEMEQLCANEAREPFDLRSGPLLRIGLLRMEDTYYVFTLTLHHIICDGWSIGIIMEELQQIYTAFAQGRKSDLPELDIQYPDFVVWQKDHIKSDAIESQLSYWRRKLAGYQRLDIPSDFPSSAERTTSSAIVSQMLERDLTEALKSLSTSRGGTMFITTLAACLTLFKLRTGRSDLALGSPLAGRSRADTEKLIGLFANPVVFRVRDVDNPRFSEFIDRVRETVWEALTNQDAPFELVLEDQRSSRECKPDPFYTVNFICQTQYARASTMVFEFCGVRLSTMPSKSQGALYDLNFFMVQREDGWRLSLEYNTDRYTGSTAQQMLDALHVLLKEIVKTPDSRLADFSIASSLASGPQAPSHNDSEVTATDAGDGIEQPTSGDETYLLPASMSQKRFWLLAKVALNSAALHMPACVKISGPLSYPVLQTSVQQLVDRHESLRATFAEVDGELCQIVHSSPTANLKIVDRRFDCNSLDQDTMTALLRAEAEQKFDLARGPLARMTLFRTGEAEHLLIVTLHHIIADGWSQGILQRDLWSIYGRQLGGSVAEMPPLEIQYGDFASWQSEWLKSGDAGQHLKYWTEKLSDPLPILNFPTDRPPTNRPASRGAIQKSKLPDDLMAALKAFGRAENVTPFMLTAAAFSVLLFHYTEQSDIVIGSPAANRKAETQDIIGPFAGPFAMRLTVDGDWTFRKILKCTSETALDAFSHSEIPFEAVIDRLKVRATGGRNPLFQFYFLYQTAFLQPHHSRDLTIVPLPTFSLGTPFEIQLAIIDRKDGTYAQLEYNPDLFDSSTIVEFLENYERLLHDIIADPDIRIADLKGRIAVRSNKMDQAGPVEYVAPRTPTETALCQMWQTLFDVQRIGLKDDFFQLGGQSLLAAQLVSEIEKNFGALIDLSTLLVATTVERLALRLEAASFQTASSADLPTSVVPLKSGSDKTPLFCFHGGGGHLLAYREMAHALDEDQPVFGIRAPDLDGAQRFLDVRQLAEDYLRDIIQVQQTGPYNLCGMSFGGLLAYEVAVRLMERGERVGVLAIFDTINPAYYRRLAAPKLARFLVDTAVVRLEKYVRDLIKGDVRSIGGYVKEFFIRRFEAVRWNFVRLLSRAAGLQMPKAIRDNVRLFDAVGKAYTPRDFEGKLTLFRASERTAEYRHDFALGWDEVANGGVEVISIDGDHLTIMEQPSVNCLAAHLTHLIERQNESSDAARATTTAMQSELGEIIKDAAE
jgi:thioesterase domain-containing protein/non-ribosomal peptide synthetase component F